MHFHQFRKDDSGAVTVDWTVLTAAVVGLSIASVTVVSGGIENLSNDIRNALEGVEMSAQFRDLIGQVCLDAGFPNGTADMTYNGMPVNAMLIYQASDFIGGLPVEAGAAAAGGNAHSLQLSPGAQPIVMLIADDDGNLHEVDNNQVLAQSVQINGETYGAGFDVSSAYTLSDSGSDMMVSSLHFGDPWAGTWQGPVIATAASNPLEPGQTYDFDGNQTTHRNEMPFSAYLGCG